MAALNVWVLLIGLALSSVTQANQCRTTCDCQDADLTEYINRALYRGFRWLDRQQMEMADELGDRFDVQNMQGFLTLQLLHPEFYAELPFEKRMLVRTLQEHAMMTTLAFARQSGDRAGSVPYVDPIQFSYQLLSMEATCIDTRQFFGRDLQYHLTRITKEFPEPNFGSTLQFAFSLLPICSSGSPFYPKAWLKLLSVRDENRPCAVVPRDAFPGNGRMFEAHIIATLSTLVMTLKCAEDQVPDDHREIYYKRLHQYSKCIADGQNATNYGFGGDLKTTALAVQALVAAGYDQTVWHCNGAVHHLLQSQQLDGSFGYGTIDEASAVLLALAGSNLGGLGKADIECPDGRQTHRLPQPINALDFRRTFQLITFNDYDGSHTKNNVSFVDGENLLQALIRAKLDPEIEFSFTAEEFELFGEEGIFLTSVNEVRNSRRNFFHWLVVKLNSDGEEEDKGLISLEDLEPEQGDVIKLVYVDVTPFDRRPPQLPRPIEEDDRSFDVQIKIKNNLTGEEESFETRVLLGENIHQALLRAWKDPEVDFTFGAAPLIIFNKPGVYLTSVNGVDAFPNMNLFWLTHVVDRDGPGGGMGGPPGGMMGGPPGGNMTVGGMMGGPPGGMMGGPAGDMMEGPPGGMMGEPTGFPPLSPQPTSLEERRLRPGNIIELVYVDLSRLQRQLRPKGNGGRDFPKDIEETDETITFTLTVYNAVEDMKWQYNVTIIEGEDLHDSFIRLWKDPDVYFIYGAARFGFFGRYGLYVTGINRLYNNREESYHWIIKRDFLEDQGIFLPIGLTDVVPEDGENVVVAYVDFSMLREEIERRGDRDDDDDDDDDDEEDDNDDEREEDEDEGEEEDLSIHDIPHDIRDCDTTANVTIIIFNALSLQFNSFIVTIIEGETMLEALLRAYKSPDIDFTFSVDTGVFLFKYDVYLTSVNGVVNDKAIGRRWLVDTDLSGNVNIANTLGLLSITPRDGSTYTLRYADLTASGEVLRDIGDELPPEIEAGDESVTFTLKVINERNGQFYKYNVTIAPGETLFHALKRAWKDEETDFNFAAFPFEFFGKTGVYLLAVNGVSSSRGDYFHWVVKIAKNDTEGKESKEDLANYQPLALNEVLPEEGSVIKLVFFDLSEIIEARRERYRFVGLPRRFFDEDQLITLTLYVANNVTGEHSKYEIKTFKGENLADILTRAWKNPNIDFRFSASPFVLFSKLGFYPVSVQGVANDPQNNLYWLIKYAPLCLEDEDEDASDESGHGPIDLIEYKAHRGYAAKLVYVDLSKYAAEVNPSGSATREMPPDIEEGDPTVKFTVVVFNKLSQRKWTYNVTILEGESLLDGFLRLWKDNNTSFHFGAVAHRFVGRFGVYITSLNGVYNSLRDLTLWVIPNAEEIERKEGEEKGDEGEKDEEEMDFSFYGLTEVFPKNEETIHVVYADLSSHRREIAELSGREEGVDDEDDEEDEDEEREGIRMHDLPQKIRGCHQTVDITVYIHNNITQERDGFNITIIEGENLLTALKRAWQDPDIDFNFAGGAFIFLKKFGIFPTSVNGLRNDPEAYHFWLVKTKGEDGEVEGGTNMLLDLTEVEPEDGSTVILLYADLSYFGEQFDLIHAELPADIEEGQATATFTLLVVHEKDHQEYNITILEGETLAEGFFRAWKDEEIMFNFLGDYMEQFGKDGFYPIAVNHVVNKRREKMWLVIDPKNFDPYSCNRYLPDEFEPISLDEYRPVDGDYLKLVYVCLEEFFYHEPGDDELPGLILEKDESFVLTMYVVNEITDEKTQYNITMLKGENLIEALLRAWKDPETDLNFSGSVFGLFNTVGYYLKSVNGVQNDKDNFFFWVVVDPTEEKARDCSERGRLTRPLALERYVPRPGFPVILAYRNFSDFRSASDVIGNGPKELPSDIDDGDNTISFNLNIVNSITGMKRSHNITIIEGETLLEAFFRAYKDPEIKLNFNADLVDFFGNFGVYFQSINGVSNDFDNLFFWCVKKFDDEDFDPITDPISVAEYFPEDGEDVHVVFVDFSPYRQDIEALLRFLRTRRTGRIMDRGREDDDEDDDEREEERQGGRRGDFAGYLPFEIEDDYPAFNISLIIGNNLTQEFTVYNLTILAGDNLGDALLRLWKDPSIDFTFAAAPFTFFGRPGLFPVSINGLANDPDALTLWSIGRYHEPENEVPIGLLARPRPGEVFTVVYVDFSPYRDVLIPTELPRDITEDDSTVDFTVYISNNITGRFCGFNLSVIAGESLLVGLTRAWKDPNIDFNFEAKPFDFFGTYGVFLVSVRDVRIDHENYYAWFAVPKPRTEDMAGAMNPEIDERIWGLTDLIPMDGYDYVLVYKDIGELFEGMDEMERENWL